MILLAPKQYGSDTKQSHMPSTKTYPRATKYMLIGFGNDTARISEVDCPAAPESFMTASGRGSLQSLALSLLMLMSSASGCLSGAVDNGYVGGEVT